MFVARYVGLPSWVGNVGNGCVVLVVVLDKVDVDVEKSQAVGNNWLQRERTSLALDGLPIWSYSSFWF